MFYKVKINFIQNAGPPLILINQKDIVNKKPKRSKRKGAKLTLIFPKYLKYCDPYIITFQSWKPRTQTLRDSIFVRIKSSVSDVFALSNNNEGFFFVLFYLFIFCWGGVGLKKESIVRPNKISRRCLLNFVLLKKNFFRAGGTTFHFRCEAGCFSFT